jgi:hypothetical protein
MKKIIVLKHNDGQLANQLWLLSHLKAYALEHNYELDIWCFNQYAKFFNNQFVKNKFISFLFYKTFPTFVFQNKNLFRFSRKIYRIIYKVLVIYPINFFYSKKIVDSSKEMIFLDSDKKLEIIKRFEKDYNFNTIYTIDWNFFAPKLLEKHRNKIRTIFNPKEEFRYLIENEINEIRKKFDYVIGLHLRFREPGDGEMFDNDFLFYVDNNSLSYIKELTEKLIQEKKINKSKTAILIVSNAKKLDLKIFDGLNIFYTPRHFIQDLFLLSQCDIILGCKTSFCSYASYYGNISILFFTKDFDKFNIKQENKNGFIWRADEFQSAL